jgi:hypothetical protein
MKSEKKEYKEKLDKEVEGGKRKEGEQGTKKEETLK